ncbi:TPA: hypothetical protein QDZ60_000168 [Stenotrophomonas maltophilia]|nr:hypothetical protein [Stenotrophomonas maltophilia]HDS1674652.1 hypothetical protein [Stenotrophomonas maltophilia]
MKVNTDTMAHPSVAYTSTGRINGIGFDGARLTVGTLTATNMIQVSADMGQAAA